MRWLIAFLLETADRWQCH